MLIVKGTEPQFEVLSLFCYYQIMLRREYMDISFSSFIEGVASSPVLCITVLLTLGVIFVNGWTDAPNAIATCVTTRCMGVRSAIFMSAAFNFLGVLVMTQINSSVASTISNMVDFGGNTHEALCGTAFYRGV